MYRRYLSEYCSWSQYHRYLVIAVLLVPSFQCPNAVKTSGQVRYIHTAHVHYPYLGRGKLLLSLSEIVILYLHLTNLTFLYRSHHPHRHMESTGGRQRERRRGMIRADYVVCWWPGSLIFCLSFFSLFSLVSRSMEMVMDMDMEMEGVEMDDALPRKRWKKELYTCTCLYLYLSVLFF